MSPVLKAVSFLLNLFGCVIVLGNELAAKFNNAVDPVIVGIHRSRDERFQSLYQMFRIFDRMLQQHAQSTR